jgi:hypothetical protein
MAKTYFLRFLIRDHADDLIVEVRKEEATRLRLMLDDCSAPSSTTRFFVFDAVDGRSIAINLSDVQAVRFLWDPVNLPPDTKRAEGAIQILLRGREAPLEEYPDSPKTLNSRSGVDTRILAQLRAARSGAGARRCWC